MGGGRHQPCHDWQRHPYSPIGGNPGVLGSEEINGGSPAHISALSSPHSGAERLYCALVSDSQEESGHRDCDKVRMPKGAYH